MLEIRILKFIHNSLNHSNVVCKILLRSKLLCIRSTVADNYRYLSYKYQLSDSDWYKDLNHLLGKAKMKVADLYKCPPIVGTLIELCELRDNLRIREYLTYNDIRELIKLVSVD